MPPDTQTLTTCARECLAAPNGHARRWARARCSAALIAAGTPDTIAADCAAAMDVVAQAIKHLAAAGPRP